MRVDSTAPIEHSSARYTACDFKDSPLGQIPQEWDVKTIAETAAPITNSFTDGDWIEAPHIRQQGIRLVQTGNIGVGEFLDKAEDRKFISQESFTALGCKPLQTGDVLICRLADPVGRACVVPDYIGDAITAVDVTIYRPNPKLLRSRFAMWQMNTHSALNRCDVLAGGTTRKRISRLNLGRLPLAVPKIEEQIAIEVVLDMVDEAIAKTEAVIAKLKQVRAGLLHDLLTRGLDENGQLRNPIAHPEQFQDSPLGGIPLSWSVLSIESVCEEIVDCKNRTPRYTDTGYPVIRTANVRDGELITDDVLYTDADGFREWTRRRVPRPGDLLITREAPVGEACLVPPTTALCLGQRMMLYAIDAEKASSTFLMYFIISPGMRRRFAQMTDGSTVGHIRLEEMRSFLVPVPEVHEQEMIGARLTEVDRGIKSETRELSKLQYVKCGLMNDLLTGHVRVPEGIAVIE